ncbi:MAG: sugar phosphate isomerase/epimerase family protein [Chthonomonadales bacterium]
MTPEVEARIIEAFQEPIRIAKEEGVVLALENEHACFVGTGAEAARILRAMDTPFVRACWDPGNAFAAGEVPYPNGYAEVRPFVVHVHVKDGVRTNGDTKWCVVGQGQVDYRGQFAALREDGYEGAVSLETHYVPEGGTPEMGSRLCLAALRQLIGD